MKHPFNPKHHAAVPNSFVVSAQGDFAEMLQEIAELAEKEGRKDVVCNAVPNDHFAFIKCDLDFAEKLKNLPHVGGVEQERRIIMVRKNKNSPQR